MNGSIWWNSKSLYSNPGYTDRWSAWDLPPFFLGPGVLGLDRSSPWIPDPNNVLINIIKRNIIHSMISSGRFFIIIIHKRDCFLIQTFYLDKITLKWHFKMAPWYWLVNEQPIRARAYLGICRGWRTVWWCFIISSGHSWIEVFVFF